MSLEAADESSDTHPLWILKILTTTLPYLNGRFDEQDNRQLLPGKIRSELIILRTRDNSSFSDKIDLFNLQVCTGKRGDGLDSTEKNCLHNCINRYMDTMNVVNQTLVSRQDSG